MTDGLRCWTELDLSALLHNLAVVRSLLHREVSVMAIVKANAYGHGMADVAQALSGKVEMFGVANLAEAAALHSAVADFVAPSRFYILGPAIPEERAEIVERGFVPAISSVEEAAAYSALMLLKNERTGDEPFRKFPIHLTIDTGMGRIGVWQDDAVEAACAILNLPGVEIAGIASHLPVSDEDDEFTRAELSRFRELVIELRAMGLHSALAHIENSAGIIGFPAQAGDMVRAGLMLYGSAPLPNFQSMLSPVLTWKTRITLVRDVPAGRGISYGRTFITPKRMRIATLGVGYADGYPRHLSGKNAEVLIRELRCPVLGRVTMDQILVDVTALPDAAPGEVVVLLGRQGSEEILAAELAEKSGTIPWEIFTRISSRVTRIHLGGLARALKTESSASER